MPVLALLMPVVATGMDGRPAGRLPARGGDVRDTRCAAGSNRRSEGVRLAVQGLARRGGGGDPAGVAASSSPHSAERQMQTETGKCSWAGLVIRRHRKIEPSSNLMPGLLCSKLTRRLYLAYNGSLICSHKALSSALQFLRGAILAH